MERRDGGREGGRDCHITTQIFHTHKSHTLSLTIIITAHMSLQKGMGSRGAYTHTKQRRIPGQARAPVYTY